MKTYEAICLELGLDDLRGADLRGADLRGADLCNAYLFGTNLEGADLREVIFRSADLRKANLRRADLRGADLYNAWLSRADLTGAKLPQKYAVRVENLAEKIHELANRGKLDMSSWHSSECKTVHCLAGHAIELAGREGVDLESNIGSSAAGAMIFHASIGLVPNFHASDEDAQAFISALIKSAGSRVISKSEQKA